MRLRPSSDLPTVDPYLPGHGDPSWSAAHYTLDLGYDRVDSHSGFSGELSLMVPIVRFPPPRSETSTYLRIYGEPGFGLRAGKGFGPYASGKVMLAFLSDERIFKFAASIFVEIQTRVPLLDPQRRDIRILAGLIATLCKHCGLD